MKNIKPSVFGLAVILLISSCSKKDVNNETADSNLSTTSAEAGTANTASWHSTSQWDSIEQDNHSVFHFNIASSSITSDIVTDGLVLVYKKNGGSTITLPYKEDLGSGSTNWYHQVTKGNVLIFADYSNESSQPVAGNSFCFLVITPDQLKSLASQGYSRSRLLDMTYEQSSKLLSTDN